MASSIFHNTKELPFCLNYCFLKSRAVCRKCLRDSFQSQTLTTPLSCQPSQQLESFKVLATLIILLMRRQLVDQNLFLNIHIRKGLTYLRQFSLKRMS